MTANEYRRLYQQVRKQSDEAYRMAMTRLAKIYKIAASDVAKKIAEAKFAGRAVITIDSLEAVLEQLEKAATKIAQSLDTTIMRTVDSVSVSSGNINKQFFFDVIEKIPGVPITRAGISQMAIRINEQLIFSLVSRIYQDGYTYSERIWKVGQNFQEQIKNVISAGLAQGRGSIAIAKDVQVFIAQGKKQLAQRYGPDLERGTTAFMKRIGNRIDARALRLVRSELYSSLMDAAVEQGKANPACLQRFLWVMEPNRQHWGCECEDYADNEYALNDLPSYPHPNCRCRVEPVLMDTDEFFSDLKDWVDGKRVGYLDEWHKSIYLPMAS